MDIQNRIKRFSPEEQIVVTNFVNNKTSCDWKCLACGTEFPAVPNTVFGRHSRRICLTCYPPSNKKVTAEEQVMEAYERTPQIGSLETYRKDGRFRVRFECLDCKNVNDFRWNDRKNLLCAYCKGSRLLCNQQAYQYLMDEKYDGQFEVLRYTSAKEKVLLRCHCGFCFTSTPISPLRERGIKCPKCQKSRSKAEIVIEKFLKDRDIPFEYQKHFEWSSIFKSRYDFYLPQNNLIIEFHGDQHYNYTKLFYPKVEDWERAKARDQIKMGEALEQGINYLVISERYESKIKEVLNNFFSSTTIPEGSKGQFLEAQNYLKE